MQYVRAASTDSVNFGVSSGRWMLIRWLHALVYALLNSRIDYRNVVRARAPRTEK